MKATIVENNAILGIIGEYSSNPGVAIINDYFERERLENLREQGYTVPVIEDTYSEFERILKRSYKVMEAVENERTNPLASSNKEVKEQAQRDKGWPEWDNSHYIPEKKRTIEIQL